jgi:iron complex transport system substrate-binding protein
MPCLRSFCWLMLLATLLLIACGTPAAQSPNASSASADTSLSIYASAAASASDAAADATTPNPEATAEAVGSVTVMDADGNTVEINDTSRIVTVGGTVTEIVFALGVGDRVVAVDTSSTYPEAATQRPQVGYQRQLAAEGVLALEPTLILASTEAGPPEALEQLRSSGVPVLVAELEHTVDGTKKMIRTLAQALNRSEPGAELIAQLDRELQEAEQVAASITNKPRVLFLYARGANTVNAAGTGTSAEQIIMLAGGQNAITEFEGFKPLTAEAAAAAAPDVILMFESGLQSLGGVDGLLQVPGIAQTPAGQNRRVVAMDGLYLTGFGPRLGAAAHDLARELQATTQE